MAKLFSTNSGAKTFSKYKSSHVLEINERFFKCKAYKYSARIPYAAIQTLNHVVVPCCISHCASGLSWVKKLEKKILQCTCDHCIFNCIYYNDLTVWLNSDFLKCSSTFSVFVPVLTVGTMSALIVNGRPYLIFNMLFCKKIKQKENKNENQNTEIKAATCTDT